MMRFFTSDLRRNLIKILCLTAGLAIGFILVAKIYVEETFDTFYPDSDRVFQIREGFTGNNGEYQLNGTTPGAIAPGTKQYVPGVEAATRFAFLAGNDENLTLENGQMLEYKGVIMADSCYFDVLTRDIKDGDPRAALGVAGHCMIPRSMAEKIEGNPIGMTFRLPSLSKDYTLTIGGVYDDFPINSSIGNYVILSLASIGDFTYDGRENWFGDERYASFMRVAQGVTPDDMSPYLEKMLKDNIAARLLEVSNYKIIPRPISAMHTEGGNHSSMIWLLTLLAVLILGSAALNYLLVVLGQMNKRSREMAIRKCYGTGRTKIFARIMGESLFYLVVSMASAVLLILAMSDTVSQIMGYSTEDLLCVGKVWLIECGVCLLLLIITGVIPAWIYCLTPVVHVFRHNPRSSRIWKLSFLALEFFASGLLICLLSLTMRQYKFMAGIDRGYDTEDIAMLFAGSISESERSNLIEALRKLPEVTGVTTSTYDLSGNPASNMIWTNDIESQYNIADLQSINPGMFDVMGIRFLQGHDFDEYVDSTTNQVIVTEAMIEVMKNHFGAEDDNMIGRTLFVSGHWDGNSPMEFTICGVVENLHRGDYNIEYSDTRPALMFPSRNKQRMIYVRFDKLTPESLSKAQALIKSMQPEFTGVLYSFSAYVEHYYMDVVNFGKAVMIAGFAILIIALIGLMGYTSDEVQRRSREIAIRKVNGTSTLSVMKLFCTDILRVALPSLLLGGATAMVIGRKWLSQFTTQVSLSPIIMVLCLIILVMLVLAVVILTSRHIARANPVNYLRAE